MSIERLHPAVLYASGSSHVDIKVNGFFGHKGFFCYTFRVLLSLLDSIGSQVTKCLLYLGNLCLSFLEVLVIQLSRF